MERDILLDRLEILIKKHRIHSIDNLASSTAINISNSVHDSILNIVNVLRDEEKEISRKDWLNGYIKCCLDIGEFFGYDKDEAYPKYDELEEIEEDSKIYVDEKFKKS